MSTGNDAVDRMIEVQAKYEAEIEGKDLTQPEKISVLLKLCSRADLGIRAFDYLEHVLILGKKS